jgi:hypothetical protein
MKEAIIVVNIVCYDRISDSLGLITVLPAGDSEYTVGSLTLGKEVMPLVIRKKGKKTVEIDVVNQKHDLDIAFIGEL